MLHNPVYFSVARWVNCGRKGIQTSRVFSTKVNGRATSFITCQAKLDSAMHNFGPRNVQSLFPYPTADALGALYGTS